MVFAVFVCCFPCDHRQTTNITLDMAAHRRGMTAFVHKNDGAATKPLVSLSEEERKALADQVRVRPPPPQWKQDTPATDDAPHRRVTLAKPKNQPSRFPSDARTGSPLPHGFPDSEYAGSDTTRGSTHHLQMRGKHHSTGGSADGFDEDHMQNVMSSITQDLFGQRSENSVAAKSYPSTTDGLLSQGDYEEEMANTQGYSQDDDRSDDDNETNEFPHPETDPNPEHRVGYPQRPGLHGQEHAYGDAKPYHYILSDHELRQQRAAEQLQELNRDYQEKQRMKQESRHASPFGPSQQRRNGNGNGFISPSFVKPDAGCQSDPTTPTRRPNQRKPAHMSPGLPQFDARNEILLSKQANNSTPERLDYDLPALFERDFNTLREESFDIDPTAVPFVLSEGKNEASLSERLSVVAKYPLEDQRRYFNSLSSAEWEQSGDWFTEQFSRVMDKMRRCRQERRHLAMQFEKEVADRHDAVIKEHLSLEGALAGMKKSGGAVLDKSTPKRKRG